MTFMAALGLALAAGLASWLGTWGLIRALSRSGVLDRPNPRSSHAVPTPRGGGIAVVGAVVLAWAAVMAATGALGRDWAVLVAALGLAVMSWRDDRAGLPVHVRLAGHAVAVLAALWSMPEAAGLFGAWLPAWLGLAAIALAWLWFVNLFNFMDGIDGLAGGEALSLGLGVAAVALLAGADSALWAMAGAVAAAALGFLVWNWQPARIFLGDVGSVPLGFLLGYLLLKLAAAGQWQAALILPLYFLADASITLALRAARGERVWQAHKDHFYQRAVAGGMSHAQVAVLALGCNAALIGCAAVAAAGLGWAGLAGACAAVAVTLWIMAR
jgi:UDP-N-acetylmuramyl pentapeptide phosphotransferase/UDP-N-acetylglucosamine-1-phosphate transferase